MVDYPISGEITSNLVHGIDRPTLSLAILIKFIQITHLLSSTQLKCQKHLSS